MKIAPDLFEAFLKCPTKCWLRATGDSACGNNYAEWVIQQNEAYRVAETARLLAQTSPADSAVSPPAENLKAAKWRIAAEVVVAASDLPRSSRRQEAHSPIPQTPTPVVQPANQSLVTWVATDQESASPTFTAETRLHAIERVPSEGRGKAAQFIPIRFIFRNKLTKDDKMLAAFDSFVLSETLGREVSVAKIIHGDDHATLKVKTSALASEVRKRLEKTAALLSSPAPPDFVLNRHCAECEFQTPCRQKALEKDDLSLLAGISEKERKKLRSRGIFTVTQLSYTFRPRRLPKRLRDKREKYHHALKALAIREKKIHIVGSPQLKIEGTPVYLDVESLPDRDFYYLIGLRIGNCDSAVQHSLWADTVEDEGKIWREFLAILETVEKPVLIHYGSYEREFLKQMSKRYGGHRQYSAVASAIDSPVNLLSFIFGRIYFPAYSNGLKEIGSLIGATWRAEFPSGTQSIVWRCAWETRRSNDLRLSLQMYNQNDCEAVCLLLAALGRIVPEALTLADVDFAHAPKQRATERGMEIHQAFKSMLRSAHADYQRSRIHLKKPRGTEAPPREKRARISPIRARDISSKSGCVISAASKRNCPSHPEETLTSGTMVEHRLIDMVFTKNGCRKTVVRYVGRRKTCPWCGETYVPPAIRRLRQRIFGHSFQAWVVYHRISLRLPMGLISKAAFDLFSVKLSQVTILGFMTQFAIEHTFTERRLLRRILAGPVVHVDETKINICGENQYVWVMTDGEHVIFRLTATREATLIQELLHGYQGILVSDFYGGYDTLPCRQQKCLVHLIRDLNDDLWKNPFNTEYESLVSAFRDLLTPILNDVERFGLKARHLRKHQKTVERFYQRVILDAVPRSEVTASYIKRFIRHRDSLFTFLHHDGVPWNNNAAERALRHFAVQRKISNSFSAQGAQQYLRLLGIAQTCRFQDKSFLRFLLSGSHDVDDFKAIKRQKKRRASNPQAS